MLERYLFEGSSPVHRLDPRVKIIVTAFASLYIAVVNNIYISVFGIVYGIVLVLISGIPINVFLKRLKAPLVFILLLWFFLPFSTGGEIIYKVFFLRITKEGIQLTLGITLKAIAILIIVVILTGTSEMVSLFHALWHLRFPKKLILLLFFTYRYIHVIFHEYLRLKKAMLVRCFHPKTDIRTYKTVAYLVGMLLVRSYDRSERVYNAMLCRGFKGNFYVLEHFHIRRYDIIFLLLSFIFFAGISWTVLQSIFLS